VHCSLIDFGRPGRIALSEHRGTLGLEDHHAPQRADRLGGVVHADEAAGAEPTQPILRGLARALRPSISFSGIRLISSGFMAFA